MRADVWIEWGYADEGLGGDAGIREDGVLEDGAPEDGAQEYGTADGVRAEVRRAVAAALEVCEVAERVIVFVDLVGPERMRAVNAQQRGIDRVTDVLSFPAMDVKTPGRIERRRAEIDPETGRVELGALLICPERALEQAQAYGHTAAREMAYLAAHGILHLLGFDHEVEADKRAMRELEERAMGICGVGEA